MIEILHWKNNRKFLFQVPLFAMLFSLCGLCNVPPDPLTKFFSNFQASINNNNVDSERTYGFFAKNNQGRLCINKSNQSTFEDFTNILLQSCEASNWKGNVDFSIRDKLANKDGSYMVKTWMNIEVSCKDAITSTKSRRKKINF